MTSKANKSIAKNTFYLYGRKLFTLIIALYTSRVLLQQLGIADFGIYGLVGSVVAIFSALRSIFSSSIQRFINIAKGNSNYGNVRDIFSIGIKIHRWIAIAFIIIVEIGGSIMMIYLDIPGDKFIEAYVVLQLSLLTAVVSILTVPYDALIIANEKFNAFALFSIVDYTLRLVIVFMLSFSTDCKLMFYALLLCIEAVIVRYLNIIYCKKTFGEESRYHKTHNPDLLKQMTRFAGWQFLGNTAYTVTNNGINFVLNIMGGVAANAARTVAYQAMSAVSQFIGDLSLSFQPRTMMLYAQGDMAGFLRLIYLNSKANFAMTVILAFPLFVLTEPIVRLWLGEIPPYSISFIRAIMIYLVFRSFHTPIDLYFKSFGDLKKYQIVELCCLSMSLPLSWLLTHLGFPLYTVFLAMAICEAVNLVTLLILARIQYGFSIREYCKIIVLRATFTLVTLSVLAWVVISNCQLTNIGIGQILIYSACLIIAEICIVSICLFSKRERNSLKQILPKIKR